MVKLKENEMYEQYKGLRGIVSDKAILEFIDNNIDKATEVIEELESVKEKIQYDIVLDQLYTEGEIREVLEILVVECWQMMKDAINDIPERLTEITSRYLHELTVAIEKNKTENGSKENQKNDSLVSVFTN